MSLLIRWNKELQVLGGFCVPFSAQVPGGPVAYPSSGHLAHRRDLVMETLGCHRSHLPAVPTSHREARCGC